MTDQGAAAAAVEWMKAFARSLEPLGVPHTLQAAGGRRGELADVADHALHDVSSAVNPRPVSREDLLGLLDAAWSD
jgi:alcohol dehydrogenase